MSASCNAVENISKFVDYLTRSWWGSIVPIFSKDTGLNLYCLGSYTRHAIILFSLVHRRISRTSLLRVRSRNSFKRPHLRFDFFCSRVKCDQIVRAVGRRNCVGVCVGVTRAPFIASQFHRNIFFPTRKTRGGGRGRLFDRHRKEKERKERKRNIR